MYAAIIASFLALSAVASGRAIKRDDVHCGTTSDATLSDCQTLVTPETWNSVFNTNNICHYTNVLSNQYDYAAFNLACYGNCCAYYTTGSDKFSQETIYQSQETLRQSAAGLLGCGDADTNTINGLENFDSGYSMCLSDGNGCGDCFDDSDFAFKK